VILQPQVIITHDPTAATAIPIMALQRATTATFFSSGVLERALSMLRWSTQIRAIRRCEPGRSLATGLIPASTPRRPRSRARSPGVRRAQVLGDGRIDRPSGSPRKRFAPRPRDRADARVRAGLRAKTPARRRARGLQIPRWPLPDVFEGIEVSAAL
jgi:hypothetical protein